MSKKLLIVCLLMGLILIFAAGVSAESSITIEDNNMMVGLDLPTVGWAISNEVGEITGYRGVNLGLGYSEKRYFDPMKYSSFNTYWGFGTIAIIMPYGEIGGDYAFARQSDGSFFTLGGRVGLVLPLVGVEEVDMPLLPMAGISLSYRF